MVNDVSAESITVSGDALVMSSPFPCVLEPLIWLLFAIIALTHAFSSRRATSVLLTRLRVLLLLKC